MCSTRRLNEINSSSAQQESNNSLQELGAITDRVPPQTCLLTRGFSAIVHYDNLKSAFIKLIVLCDLVSCGVEEQQQQQKITIVKHLFFAQCLRMTHIQGFGLVESTDVRLPFCER